jgi:hypothetical protein
MIMKKLFVLLAALAWAATGCHSTADNGASSNVQLKPYAPNLAPTPYPPSPNTINNPPAVISPPVPPNHP